MDCKNINHFIPITTLFVILLSTLACKHSKIEYSSEVKNVSFFSELVQDSLSYNIYIPNIGKSIDGHHLLYLLHGHGGNHDDWFDYEEGRVQLILDSLIKRKLIPPLIAVSLDAANSWYVDRHISMESVYFNEFITHIEKSPELIINNEKRIIAGNSAGGFGALRFILKYPEHFTSAILLSPAAYVPSPPAISSSRTIDVFAINKVFNDSIWNSFSYRQIVIDSLDHTPYVFISTGIDDKYGIVTVIDSLKAYFDTNDIDYNVTLMPGGHEWDVWREVFTRDLIKAVKE